MQVVSSDQESCFLANGNKIKGGMDHLKDNIILSSPEVCQRLQDYKEELIREKQFSDLILHVIEKIEKDAEESLEDLWSEVSLLDMKRYLKEGISVAGVSESSPIIILESVDNKICNTLHNFNIFEISQLAECTKVEIDNIASQVKSLQSSDIEYAVQDAKSTLKILSAIQKDGEDNKGSSWNSWGNITQVSNLLQIKKNTKKIASMLNPKTFGASLVDVFVGHEGQDTEELEDDSFQAI